MNSFAVARFAKDPVLARLPIDAYTCPLRFKVRPSHSPICFGVEGQKAMVCAQSFFVAQIAVSLGILLPCQDGASGS